MASPLPQPAPTHNQVINSEKPSLNALVIGKVDAGKSTAMGHLLYQFGITDYTSSLQLLNKSSNEEHSLDPSPNPISFNQLMQHIQQSRSESEPNNLDIHPDFTKFYTDQYLINVIDVPGHRNFVSNLITGATRADIAVLVVSVNDTKVDNGGSDEASEHVTLAYTLGIKQLIVAVNKMDQVDWNQEVYLRVVKDVSSMLRKVGYLVQSVPFVPISGTTGDGLFKPTSEAMPWYTGWHTKSKSGGNKSGMTFIDALDAIDAPHKIGDKPLRISIQDIYKVSSVGTMPVGKIESGILRPGMKVRFAPGNAVGTVISVEARRQTDSSQLPTSTTEAYPGDNVGFGVSNISVRDVRRGHICSEASDDLSSSAYDTVSFTAQIIVMFTKTPNIVSLKAGDEPVMDAHTAHVGVRVTEVLARIDRRTGQVVESLPKQPLSPGDAAVIKCVPLRPLCIEPFAEYPSLGRLALRASNRHTIAVGIVKSVDKRLENGQVVTYPVKSSMKAGTTT